MIAEIRPLDTLFFKDGKPFSMGQETWADGVFPPYPSVIFGALRTWFISQHAEPFSQKAIEESENITINQFCYRIAGSGIYFPMPLDLAESKSKDSQRKADEKDKKEYEVLPLKPELIANLASNYPYQRVLMPPEGEIVEEVEQGLIEEMHFISYLNGAHNHYTVKKIKDYVKSEPKTGIGRNNVTNTASDAMLYRVGMRRALDMEFLINFNWSKQEDTEEGSSFFIKFGAENKMAGVRRLRVGAKIDASRINLKGNRFKLYLSTPAIFKKNGWYPDLNSCNIEAELVAASVGKPLHIGGFDMKKNEPKTMFKAVPAGSVFFYESAENPDVLMNKLFGKSISEEMQGQGFGIAYVGTW